MVSCGKEPAVSLPPSPPSLSSDLCGGEGVRGVWLLALIREDDGSGASQAVEGSELSSAALHSVQAGN